MLYKDRPTIGLFSEILTETYMYSIIKGIYDTCNAKKVNFRIFLGSDMDSSNRLNQSKNIIYKYAGNLNVDALIITPACVNSRLSRELFSKFISYKNVIKLSLGMISEKNCSILINNKGGIFNMVCHLIEDHDYKKIAYIGGPPGDFEAEARLEGYKKALKHKNIPFNKQLFAAGDFHLKSGYSGCVTFFEKRKVTPDAIVCANDNTAMGVYDYCKKKGIRIPQDLAVTGFDNVKEAFYLKPQLSTVAQPLYGQGVTAVTAILARLEGRPAQKVINMPTTLMLRRSCGCPSQDKIIHKQSTLKGSISEEEKTQIQNSLQQLKTKIKSEYMLAHQKVLFSILDKTVAILRNRKNKKEHLKTIRNILKSMSFSETELITQVDYIHLFYKKITNRISSPESRALINDIFISIHHLTQITLRRKLGETTADLRGDAIRYKSTLYKLSSCLNFTDLFEILKTELINQGFKFFYLSLYQGKKHGCRRQEIRGKKMRLFIGYNGKTLFNGMKKKCIFQQKTLIPPSFFPRDKHHSFLAYPLVTDKYIFGTFIIEFNEDKLNAYDPIYQQLSATLNMIRLFNNSQQKKRELNEININLEQKVKERTLRLTEANQKLQELDRIKTTFFANISHELRTPLTLLLGPLESFHIGDYGPVLKKDDRVVSSMIANGSRLLKLINTLLDFSRLDAGKMQPHKKISAVSGILNYYMSILKSSAEAKGIKTEYVNKNGKTFALIDRELFEKAFYNLISNALKFTPTGGTIKVILKKNQTQMSENTFSIEVHDTGRGIEEDKIGTIFERFARLDENEDRNYEGTGIGLAFTKEIIKLHGGTISAESTFGKGSIFTITLPLENPQNARDLNEDEIETVKKYLLHDLSAYSKRTEETDTVHSPGSAQDILEAKTICVIDDNSDMREYLTSILEKNYRVVTSENGQKGLALIKYLMPDLVISDVMMPVMNGLELCRIIKTDPALKHIPVLLLTARMDISGKLEGLEGKADDYLFKPFNAREILTRLKNLLSNRELQIELSGKQLLIMNSIKYAARIQRALLPSPSALRKQLASFFTLYEPRDIVGGDIYWFKDYGDSFLIALADCTGHGIPGALMTMITHSLLNRITEHINHDNPARILSELNKLIKKALDQVDEKDNPEESLSDDGLDIGLCWINKKEQTCIYAGARRPLYYIKNGKLQQLDGDKKSIGYRQIPYETSYSNQGISFSQKTLFYLTTDGYADQIGGSRAFGTRRLKKLLMEVQNKSLKNQQKELKKNLTVHMDGHDQIDDYTIIGFLLPLE